jgi:hypothetical protein
MDLKVIGWKDMDWAQVIQDRDKWQVLENVVRDSWVPSNAVNFFVR